MSFPLILPVRSASPGTPGGVGGYPHRARVGPSPSRNAIALIFAALVLLVGARAAFAHPARMATGIATVRPDGQVRLSLNFDMLAFLLNDTPQRVVDSQMYELLDGPVETLQARVAEGRERLPHAVRVLADGVEVPMGVAAFPTAEGILRASRSAGGMRIPVVMDCALQGQLPPATRSVAFKVSDVMDTVIVTVEREEHEPLALPVTAGTPSDAVPVSLGASAATSPASGPAAPVGEPGTLTIALRYVGLGFTHIIPEGTDHILFVLGLFLLSPKIKPLLAQVTAFTVAHSITLGLAMYGIVNLPPRFVEPVIALSIAFVAIENLYTSQLKPWRPLVVFGFGLVHGMGFASALGTLPRGSFLPALVSFNVGVELGQLSVIAAAFLVVGWFRSRTWYRPTVVIPASVAIAAMGIYWAIDRIAHGGA